MLIMWSLAAGSAASDVLASCDERLHVGGVDVAAHGAGRPGAPTASR